MKTRVSFAAALSALTFCMAAHAQAPDRRAALLDYAPDLSERELSDLVQSTPEIEQRAVVGRDRGEAPDPTPTPPPPSAASAAEAVAVRLNGLEPTTAALLPALVERYGADHYRHPTTTLASGRLGRCNRYKLTMRRTEIDLPVRADTVDGAFGDARRVDTTWQLRNARASTRLRLRVVRRDNHPWWCVIQTLVDQHVDVDVSDLRGDFDIALGADSATDAVTLERVRQVTLALGDIEVDFESDLLQRLYDFGLSIYALFDGDCDDFGECAAGIVNDLIAAHGSVIRRGLQSALTGALTSGLSLSGGVSDGAYAIDYDVDLDGLRSAEDHDTMTSLWRVALAEDGALDPCADDLSVELDGRAAAPGDAALTRGDVEVDVPLDLIAEAGYLVGAQGALCVDDLAMPLVGFRVSARPAGAIRLDAVDDDGAVALSLPLRVEWTQDAEPAGRETVEARLVGRFATACDAGLFVELTEVDITARRVPAVVESRLASALRAEVDRLPLLPSVTTLNRAGALELTLVDVATASGRVALGLAYGDRCALSGGGGYTPGPGGGGSTPGPGEHGLPGPGGLLDIDIFVGDEELLPDDGPAEVEDLFGR